ncbi:MAG: 30S ribosomal protein S3 [Candidatus Pacebacteria bacterium]|nr:30S ribosomal protein S3 [Candidatus Paceibacterota bacterium]
MTDPLLLEKRRGRRNMTHKAHPKIFRIKNNSDWDSRWLNQKNFPEYLEEDFLIREFIESKLKDSGIDRVEIERFPGKINIIINSARPGLIIGRGGQGVEQIKRALFQKIFRSNKAKIKEIKVEIKGIKNPWLKARLIGQWTAQQIEKRMPYRRVLKQAIEKVMNNKEVKGIRIEVAGRLNGAEIARRDWLSKGQLPRQTLRVNIEYARVKAYCSYGVIGIKVWIYVVEKDKEEKNK